MWILLQGIVSWQTKPLTVLYILTAFPAWFLLFSRVGKQYERSLGEPALNMCLFLSEPAGSWMKSRHLLKKLRWFLHSWCKIEPMFVSANLSCFLYSCNLKMRELPESDSTAALPLKQNNRLLWLLIQDVIYLRLFFLSFFTREWYSLHFIIQMHAALKSSGTRCYFLDHQASPETLDS